MGLGFQAHLVIEQGGRVDEGVAVDAAKPGEAGFLQTGDHAEHLSLGAVFHLGLEAHDIEERPELVVAAQLHDGIGFLLGCMGVGEADGLHRAEAQGFAAPFGHDLDGQAPVEIAGGLALVELGLVSSQKRVDERLVGVAVHGAVEVGGALFLGLALVIARLHPGLGHVDAVGMHDGGDGVEEGKAFLSRLAGDGLGQRARGQGASCNDRGAALGQGGDFLFADADQRMIAQAIRHRLGEGVPVDGQCAPGGKAVTVGHFHDQPVCGPHFPMQQADGVLFVVIRAEGIGTDHLGQVAGLVGEGADGGAHFVDDHGHAERDGLPGGLGPGHAAADDMDRLCHGPRCRPVTPPCQDD